MKNIIRTTLSIILSSVTLLSFASCSDNTDDSIKTGDGTEYIVARDEDGNIIINDSNKLKVYTVNENGKKQKADNGEYITEFIDFNGQVVTGNTVETAEMRFELPDKFISDINNPGYFYYDEYDAEIFFTYMESTIENGLEAAETNCENLLESYGSETFEYNKYTLTVSEKEAPVFVQKCNSSENYRHAYTCFIPYDTGYYQIDCVINSDKANKVDYNDFLENIELK